MFLKRILSFLCLCSLGCTCLVTSTLAQALGTDNAPCHHMAMDMGADEHPQDKNCCTEKIEAWREAVPQDDGVGIDDVPVTLVSSHNLAVTEPVATPYAQGLYRYKLRPPAHIYSWKTIRLIL